MSENCGYSSNYYLKGTYFHLEHTHVMNPSGGLKHKMWDIFYVNVWPSYGIRSFQRTVVIVVTFKVPFKKVPIFTKLTIIYFSHLKYWKFEMFDINVQTQCALQNYKLSENCGYSSNLITTM